MLRYDFEMFRIDDSASGAVGIFTNRQTNIGQDTATRVVATFKDPKTIDAVSNAPPIIRLFLEEAGFGVKDSSVERVSCPNQPTLIDMRRALVAQLTAALSNRAMKKALGRAAYESAFNINAFISAVVSDDLPDDDIAVEPVTTHVKVAPRRPCDLRRKGLKSRVRPH